MSKIYFIAKEYNAPAFSAKIPPVLEIDPGDVVTFETTDSAYARLHAGADPDEIEEEAYNAVTGPVLVRGAEPGDALRIDLLDIRVDRIWALWSPGFGPLGQIARQVQIRPLAVVDGQIALSERLVVPFEPMIGCIGVAPARGKSSTLAPAYPWGGNMDLRELSPGTTVLLPVQVRGGLLSLGDIHAAMGCGEPTWVGLETAGKATVRIGLIKGFALEGPRLRLAHETIEVVCVSGKHDFEEAQEQAALRAYNFLRHGRRESDPHDVMFGLDPFEAYAYCCARVGLRLGGPASPIVLAVIPDAWSS